MTQDAEDGETHQDSPEQGESGQHLWPGAEDAPVIDAMLADYQSPHWHACWLLVSALVRQAKPPTGLDEEVTQQVMLQVVRHLPTFRRDCRLTTWLVTIVRRALVDAWRATLRKRAREMALQSGGDAEESLPAQEWTYYHRTTEEECLVREALRQAISDLLEFRASRGEHTSRDGLIVLLALLEDLPRLEVARRLDVPPQTVADVVHAARKFLRDRMADTAQGMGEDALQKGDQE